MSRFIAGAALLAGSLFGPVAGALPVDGQCFDPVIYQFPGSVDAPRGGVAAGLGDIDGDGDDEVAFWSDTTVGMVTIWYPGAVGGSAHSRIRGAEPDGQFGRDIAPIGDMNGDGYDDFVVACTFHRVDTSGLFTAWEPAAFVYFGREGGLPVDVTEADARIDFGLTSYVSKLTLAPAGDVNGDGYDDLVIGASLLGVYVWTGGPTPLADVQDLSSADWYAPRSDLLGISVAGAGDVNGDGYDDLLVSDGIAGSHGIGTADLYWGGPTGLADPPSPGWSAHGSDGDAGFGRLVAGAGDVNGDGYADVMTAAAQAGSGRVYMWHGGPDGPAGGATGGPENADWRGESNEGTGRALAAGDVDGDGYADVIVSSLSPLGGTVRVWRGAPDGLPGPVGTSSNDCSGIGPLPSSLGFTVATGDIDGDGRSDVIVGDPTWEDDVDERVGRVSILTTRPTPYFPDVSTTVIGTGITRSAIVGDVNGDGYAEVAHVASDGGVHRVDVFDGGPALFDSAPPSFSVTIGTFHRVDALASAGDVNGDGYEDLFIAALDEDPLTGSDTAAIWYGGPDGIDASASFSGADWSVIGSIARAGIRALGDVDGDGFDDVGIRSRPPSGSEEDSAHLWYGSPSGPRPATGLYDADWTWSPEIAADAVSAFAGGDMDGDGVSDLIVFTTRSTGPGSDVRLWLGASGERLAPGTAPTLERTASSVIVDSAVPGDVSGDGNDDFVYLNGVELNFVSLTPTGHLDFEDIGFVPVSRVVPAGDVNGDGLADVIAFHHLNPDEDALLWFGATGGPDIAEFWISQPLSVGAGGDVDGDGRADIVDARADGTRVYTPHPRSADELDAVRQLDTLTDTPISPSGASDSMTSFRVSIPLRSAAGRTRARVELQLARADEAFDDGERLTFGPFDTGEPGALDTFETTIHVPETLIGYRWRARVVSAMPGFDAAPWRTIAPTSLAHVRMIDPATPIEGAPDPIGPPSAANAVLRAAPNPFGARTNVDVSFPALASAEVGVFDAGGRLVRSLLSGVAAPGVHRFAWDGRDGAGRNVAPGTYFVTLRSGTEVVSRKVTKLP